MRKSACIDDAKFCLHGRCPDRIGGRVGGSSTSIQAVTELRCFVRAAAQMICEIFCDATCLRLKINGLGRSSPSQTHMDRKTFGQTWLGDYAKDTGILTWEHCFDEDVKLLNQQLAFGSL